MFHTNRFRLRRIHAGNRDGCTRLLRRGVLIHLVVILILVAPKQPGEEATFRFCLGTGGDRAMAKASARKTLNKPTKLGDLPEWNLKDLYPALDSPEVKRDLDLADSECAAFEQDFKGRLATFAAGEGGGAALAKAIKRYEAIDDRLGRLMSYASLVYAGNTTDPVHAKFYGDIQERITAASLHLLFFTLELNRIDDAQLEAAMLAMYQKKKK